MKNYRFFFGQCGAPPDNPGQRGSAVRIFLPAQLRTPRIIYDTGIYPVFPKAGMNEGNLAFTASEYRLRGNVNNPYHNDYVCLVLW
jgi:hypothetical protein